MTERLRRHRRTKIIATLGPASSTPEMMGQLFQAGADVFRLNFSHGSHEDHAARIEAIRAVEKKFGRPIGILADVQGPKLRVGQFQSGRVQLQAGQSFVLDMNPAPGDTRRVCLPHPEIISAAEIGATLLLDDGKLRLRVVRKRDDHLMTEILNSGVLSDRKGVNVPDVVLPIPALTKKDLADLEFVLPLGIDYIGLSFVQRPEDVLQAKAIAAGRALVMVKLEKPQALENLDGILDAADAVMVARGDLGVELPPEDVPIAQKRIIRAAQQRGMPVVVATQMLESMITAPAPRHRCQAPGAGTLLGRCDRRRRRAGGAHDRRAGHRGAHRIRFHGVARGARAAGLPGAGPDHQRDRGAPPRRRLGRACRGHPRGAFHVRRGGQCREDRPPRRLRQQGRRNRRGRRRAVRPAGYDQRPPRGAPLERDDFNALLERDDFKSNHFTVST
jgi:hypothetical protein